MISHVYNILLTIVSEYGESFFASNKRAKASIYNSGSGFFAKKRPLEY
jgi:hypothetical protein